jgi:hypothetical protein
VVSLHSDTTVTGNTSATSVALCGGAIVEAQGAHVGTSDNAWC